MRASSLYFLLGIAPLAICAPTPEPGSSMDRAEEAPVRRQGVATPPTAWSTDDDSTNNAPRPGTRDVWKPRPELFYPMTGGAPAGLTRHRNERIPNERSPYPNSRTPAHPKTQVLPVAHQPHVGMPCHGGERDDMLIVWLVVAFMGVVIVLETWERIFPRQGTIRLEETTCHPPISIRVTPAPDDEDEDGIRDEKDWMESDRKHSS